MPGGGGGGGSIKPSVRRFCACPPPAAAGSEAAPAGTIVYTIDGKAAGDSWNRILVVLNGNGVEKEIHLPQGKWKQALQPSANAIDAGKYSAGSYTAAIFYEE